MDIGQDIAIILNNSNYPYFILPKGIYITPHAAEKYLERILKRNASKKTVRTAQLFLSYVLSNRACRIIEDRIDTAAYRIKLVYQGIRFVYEPNDRRVYSIYKDPESQEILEMSMRIPADFSVAHEVKDHLGRKIWEKFFIKKWPVLTARGVDGKRKVKILRIQVGACIVDLDMQKRLVLQAKGPRLG